MNTRQKMSIALILATMISQSALHAQGSNRFSINVQRDENVSGNAEKNIYVNNIPAKALRHFHKNFKVNGSEYWEVISDGYIATSTVNNVKQRVFYRNNGEWRCTIKDYHGATIPSGIKNVLKETRYEDYDVTHVSEIQFFDSSVSIVQIYNGRLYKILRIANDEIQVLKEFVDLNRAADPIP